VLLRLGEDDRADAAFTRAVQVDRDSATAGDARWWLGTLERRKKAAASQETREKEKN